MSILGNRVLRVEDPAILVGGREYLEDIQLPGMAFVTYVRSNVAHARIVSVDTSEAAAAPGVIGVFTASDFDLAPAIPTAMMMPPPNPAMLRSWLADGVVRFVGEQIVAIVSETRAQGADAAELVVVDYDPLPAVIDLEEAVKGDVLLYPETGSNVAMAVGEQTEGFFDGCEVVVRVQNRHQRLAPSPMEVRGSVAKWEDDGRLTFWTTTQTPHVVRDVLAMNLGLEQSGVHVITPAVGGGFGAKGEWYQDQLLPAWLARMVDRLVKWVETRSESMVSMIHGRSQWQDVEIGGKRDGTLEALRQTVIQDVGAYPGLATVLPAFNLSLANGPYTFQRVETPFKCVATTTTPLGAYRGAGRPEVTDALERAVDAFAAEIGMDPVELRRKNLITPDAFPYETPCGGHYDSGNYQAALDSALDTLGYDALRAEQAKRRADGSTKLLGIGVSTYVEAAGVPIPEFGAMELLPDGKAVVYTGTASHGQGHGTTWAMVVSDKTGIPVEDIEVVYGDTDRVHYGIGTFGSRSAIAGGGASREVAVAMVDKACEHAAALLEASPDDVVLDVEAGKFHVAGSPAISKSWGEVAAAASAEAPLRTETMYTSPHTAPSGTHIAVVEVDAETGHVALTRFVAVDDAGVIINPLLAEGQIAGGIAQGVAQALYEHFQYDADGNPLTANFLDYTVPSAPELPLYESSFVETPTPLSELGVKGLGESGTIGATAAVHNAVIDALAHLGIRHIDMPLTPHRVWSSIVEASA